MFTKHLVWIATLALAPVSFCLGQAAPDIYAEPQNLEVLPPDISPAELRATMKSFAIGTGLRCSSCHVGEEGADFSTYDFSSDDKHLKRTARVMLRMVNDINATHLAKLEETPQVRVECATCHRGVVEPKLTGQVLAEAAEDGGPAAIAAKWEQLRTRYYGTHSYDFSELTLSEFAQARFAAGEPEQARAALEILVEEHPDALMGHFMLGELDRMAGNTEAAREGYLRALEIDPDAAWIRQRLDALDAPAAAAD